MPDKSPNQSTADEHEKQGDSTLLPMLIGGLVLIVIGAVIVMTFV